MCGWKRLWAVNVNVVPASDTDTDITETLAEAVNTAPH